MLASSFQSDPFPQARQVAARYLPDSATATIVPLTGMTGFSGAVIYRVEHHGREYCLRRWPATAPDPVRLAGLHRLLEHTSHLGITQVAVPRKSLSGSTLIWEDNAWWQLEPWLPGRADFHASPSRARLQHSMQVLARWHLAAASFVPSRDEATWFATLRAPTSPGLEERGDAILHWRNAAGMISRQNWLPHLDEDIQRLLAEISTYCVLLAPQLLRKLSHALRVEVPLQPCLRDVWHDHLLFTGDELTGLIDPNACRMENVTTDLARLLGSLLEDNPREWAFALDCYQAVRPLSLTELQLLPLFDESCVLLSGITWLDWLLNQRRRFANRQQVLDRMQAIQRRLLNLRMRESQ